MMIMATREIRRDFMKVNVSPSHVTPPSPAARSNLVGRRQLEPTNPRNCSFEASKQGSPGKKGLVSLGTISKETATVSELIYRTPFKKDCWNIVLSSINADKPYKTIPPGTEVYLDPETREVFWGKELAAFEKESSEPVDTRNAKGMDTRETIRFSPMESQEMTGETSHVPDFSEAVREFIGKDYNQMDCYELVVGGLRNLGVRYRGKGGLGEELIKRAREKGYASNHYLTGEGLVSASGSDVYKKRFASITDPEKEADAFLSEITGILKQGQILSFSTQTRGHTGVVSQVDGTWTFINSGTMDNTLEGRNGGRRVGEERLSDEIKNWFRLAGNRKEGLMISIGSIDLSKLAAYTPAAASISERA